MSEPVIHAGWGDDAASFADELERRYGHLRVVPQVDGKLGYGGWMTAYFDKELGRAVIQCSCVDVCIAGSEDCLKQKKELA